MVRYDLNIANKWNLIFIYGIDLEDNIYGVTKSFMNKKISVVLVKQDSNNKRLLNTITHELKHVQSHICKYYDIEEDSEDAAYLYGYLAGNTINYFIKGNILY